MTQYRFLAPLMEHGDARPFPGWVQQPEIHQTELLDTATARELADIILSAHLAGQSFASRTRYAANTSWDVNGSFRSSKNIPTTLDGLATGFAAMQRYAEQLMPAFGVDAKTYRLQPVNDQCLLYQTGDYIRDHADDSALHDVDGQQVWRAIKPDRHLVGIVWLTSQHEQTADRQADTLHAFEGGELQINSLVDVDTGAPLSICPQAGAMVLFPANPWYRHEVLPVRSGTRVALTRWWKIALEAADET